ncbi:hypothetical protein H0H92_013547 [Tricholoma furcatifolium]|nr:hypothetical protein H0H92_013547 [Tricholoma furcatifolium]
MRKAAAAITTFAARLASQECAYLPTHGLHKLNRSSRSVLDGLLCEESSSKKEKKKPDADSLEYYVVRVERLAAKLTNIIGSSPYDYFESCVVQYIDNTASDVIPNVIPRIRRLESKVMKYSPEVLKRAGYGMEWTRVQEVAKRISDVLYCLHELVSCTSSAMQDVVDAHAKKGLMYQRLPL